MKNFGSSKGFGFIYILVLCLCNARLIQSSYVNSFYLIIYLKLDIRINNENK